jgi:hypothetical protein
MEIKLIMLQVAKKEGMMTNKKTKVMKFDDIGLSWQQDCSIGNCKILFVVMYGWFDINLGWAKSIEDNLMKEGQHVDKLTKSQKRAALQAISVIKEKRCEKIKGRTVADGRPQRAMYTKDKTTSPTVSTDALMLSIMINACEQRDVAMADVAGAYLHADLEDYTLLKRKGESVDIMCKVCGDYRMFVTREHGKKVLYLRLLKALYGCVMSALLR